MLQAMLRGKLSRDVEGKEDILTSNVFGTLRYSPNPSVLLQFLGGAFDPIGKRYFRERLNGYDHIQSWEFWPWYEHGEGKGCEPDVVIVLADVSGRKFGVVIEAKYRSGKSSHASEAEKLPNDQLARQLLHIRALARLEEFADYAVVYVTTAVGCPIVELMDSVIEYQHKCGEPASIFWASWRALPEMLRGVTGDFKVIATDLGNLLYRMDLVTFHQLRSNEVTSPGWSFANSVKIQPDTSSWNWSIPAPDWNFVALV